MRRVVTIWAWIGFLAVTPAATQARAQAQPGLKIAFISSQQILEQTPGYAAAEAGEVGRAQPVRGRPASEGTAGGGEPGGRGAGAARRISAREIAALTNGRLVGAPDVTVSGVAPLDRAGPDDLSFLAAKRYLQYFQQSSAAIVLCKPDLV